MRAWNPAQCVTRTLNIACTKRVFSTSRVHLQHKVRIANLLERDASSDQVEVNGWVRSVRKQKRIAFAALGDGSTIDSIQAVLKPEQAAE